MYIILVTALTFKVNPADMMYIVKFKYISPCHLIILCKFTIFMFVYLPSELWSMLYDCLCMGWERGGLWGEGENFWF